MNEKEMTNEEYQNFLDTINTLPERECEIIKRGVLQLNDDKKQLLEIISELQQRIEKAIEEINHYDTMAKHIDDTIYLDEKLANNLLEILKGGNK